MIWYNTLTRIHKCNVSWSEWMFYEQIMVVPVCVNWHGCAIVDFCSNVVASCCWRWVSLWWHRPAWRHLWLHPYPGAERAPGLRVYALADRAIYCVLPVVQYCWASGFRYAGHTVCSLLWAFHLRWYVIWLDLATPVGASASVLRLHSVKKRKRKMLL